MRHQRKTIKLGRTAAHRNAMLRNQAASLIEHSRIKTTLAKAKALRPFAEKLVSLGKSGTLHSRRLALSRLGHGSERIELVVQKLFGDIATRCAKREGGYLRIIKLGPRKSDSAPMALVEWVDGTGATPDETPAKAETAAAPKARAKKPAAAKKEKAPAKEADEKPARKPRAKKSADKPSDE